ncbi:MAG: LacI family transcriptional regulator [Clostridiales Family XIII bacterium]|jgi:LacI family transcriptional regulator/LacI family purine nucleotide synthesis repressor|nr:LacI family transcriptional regulator [Clostridiales Family XIII bacterium]
MVSMKNVADACGVSVATVSKALNDHSDIGQTTKDAVRQKAKELGYFANSSARSLRTSKSYNIGILFEDEARSGLTHDFFSSVINSFKVTVEKLGYDITFINNRGTGKLPMSFLGHCKYRGFDGVMIVCMDMRDAEVRELAESDLPIVAIDYQFKDKLAVFSNNNDGVHKLATYAYEQGHRKIAYIHGAASHVTEKRVDSFFEFVKEKGLEQDIPEEYIRIADYRNVDAAAKETEALLDLPNPPTCILYPDDFSTIGGINVFKARNMRIPEDISIAGYDGIQIASVLEPKLTTIKQDTVGMGKAAAINLINYIENPEGNQVMTEVLDVTLVEGKSLGKLGK